MKMGVLRGRKERLNAEAQSTRRSDGRKKDPRWGSVKGAKDRRRLRGRPKVALKRDPTQLGSSHSEKELLEFQTGLEMNTMYAHVVGRR
jgi:hypothetical protein